MFLSRQIVEHVKSIDTTRPVTLVSDLDPDVDHAVQYIDIITMNQYAGWYDSIGDIDVIVTDITSRMRRWYQKHNKPVVITEYGCDTIEGLHAVLFYYNYTYTYD